MASFVSLEDHFGSIPATTVGMLTAADRAAGRQQAYAQRRPEQLEALRRVAIVESTEASNAIENIHASHARIEKLIDRTAEPRDRSEQEIAGYRYVLDLLHADAERIDFEPRFVEQLHGYLARYTGDSSAGYWKGLDNTVEEQAPDGTKRVRFVPVSAAQTPAAMEQLHREFNEAWHAGRYHHLLLTAAYVLDFLVIHPFRDGNGRMSRLISLWLLYRGGYEVGRYISLERLIQESKETYYDALQRSTAGWHGGAHDLRPWTEYFLGTINAAYAELESRTSVIEGSSSKRMLVKRFVATSLSSEFRVADVRRAAPGVSDSTIEKVLSELKHQGIIERIGAGRGSRWRRLRADFLDDTTV